MSSRFTFIKTKLSHDQVKALLTEAHQPVSTHFTANVSALANLLNQFQSFSHIKIRDISYDRYLSVIRMMPRFNFIYSLSVDQVNFLLSFAQTEAPSTSFMKNVNEVRMLINNLEEATHTKVNDAYEDYMNLIAQYNQTTFSDTLQQQRQQLTHIIPQAPSLYQ
jgi:ABC-type transporter Mla subunit MlaD